MLVDQELRAATNLEKYRTFPEDELTENEREKKDEQTFQHDQKLSEMKQVLARTKKKRQLGDIR